MKTAKYIRWATLGIILSVTMIIHYLHIHGGVMYPSVHAVCPLGGLENLWAWVGGKANLQKLFSGTMTLFFFTLVFTLLFGKAFCGQICPFGALQELMGKLCSKKVKLPEKIDRPLRLLKYAVLVFVTVMAWTTSSIWISSYDPYSAFAHIWSGGELFNEMSIGFAILVIVLIASTFIDRFFCKYFCPAGALYGMISKISPTRIERKDCSSCGLCSKSCPMGINISKMSKVTSPECIVCGHCVTACPTKGKDLKITVFGKVIKPLFFGVTITAVFFGSLFVFDAAGIYQVTIPALETISESGKYLKIVDLRGSMSIENGAKYTGMDLSEFYELMEIPDSVPKETLLKAVVYYVPGYDFHVIKATR